MEIILIWRNKVYRMKGDFYSVREKLGVEDHEITPWASAKDGDEWTKRFI